MILFIVWYKTHKNSLNLYNINILRDMRNLLIILILSIYSITSYSQNTGLKLKSVKSKYQNFFFRSPGKYNSKEQVFKVKKISFSTSHKGSNSKNQYQISISGFVNNSKEDIIYNAKSISELEYYSKIFKSNYTKILLFEYSYFIESKKYYDTSISVEY